MKTDDPVPDFDYYAREYINHPQILKLKEIKHHNDSIYEHTIRVAQIAFKIGKKLSKHPDQLVRAAFFHDLYYHDWREKQYILVHGWVHPRIALKNAQKYFGPVTSRESNAIVSHMWPFNIEKLPLCREAFILAIADRTVSIIDFFMMFVDIFKRKPADHNSTGNDRNEST